MVYCLCNFTISSMDILKRSNALRRSSSLKTFNILDLLEQFFVHHGIIVPKKESHGNTKCIRNSFSAAYGRPNLVALVTPYDRRRNPHLFCKVILRPFFLHYETRHSCSLIRHSETIRERKKQHKLKSYYTNLWNTTRGAFCIYGGLKIMRRYIPKAMFT